MDKSKCLSVKTKKIGNLHTRQISYFVILTKLIEAALEFIRKFKIYFLVFLLDFGKGFVYVINTAAIARVRTHKFWCASSLC